VQSSRVTSDGRFDDSRGSKEGRDIHVSRAREHGRGRHARNPLQIPWLGWRDIILRTYAKMFSDRLFSVAGGAAFFILFAIFPAIAALISLYGLFLNPSTITQRLSMANDLIPQDVLNLLRQQAARIASQSHGVLTIGFLAGLLVTFWSAMSGVKAMIDALNVIYAQEEARGLFRFNLVAFLFSMGGLAIFLIAIGAVAAVPLTLSWLGLGAISIDLMRIARWPVLLIVLLLGLAVLYRHGPHRRPARWQWVSVGSVFASVLWIAASYLFSWYLAKFNSYNATYGSLGAVVAMMMWLWISTCVVLLGAELNAEIEHQTADDSTTGGDKPLGERGAVMADTVGAKQE